MCHRHRVFCDVGTYVSCPGYVGILKEHGFPVNQGGTADKQVYSSLTGRVYLSRTFFLYRKIKATQKRRWSFVSEILCSVTDNKKTIRRCAYVINQTMATPKRVPERECVIKESDRKQKSGGYDYENEQHRF